METMQGLTPTITIRVPATIDLTEAGHHYVSFKQGRTLLKITDGLEITAHAVSVYLTQEDTLRFDPGLMTMQLNWTYQGGQRGAINEIPIMVNANHLPEVLA